MNSGKSLQKKYIFILLIFFCTFFISGATYAATPDTSPESTFTPKPGYKPIDPDPIRIGAWVTGGFKQQPVSSHYMTLGDSYTLHAQSVRSFASVLVHPNEKLTYSWIKTSDGINWEDIPNSNTPDLKINSAPNGKFPDIGSSGTVWYQAKASYLTFVFPEDFRSKISAIHVLENSIKATDIDISLESNYIYNIESDFDNNSITAIATPTPQNATGLPLWSISDSSLATIDPETGMITANKNHKDGSFFIKATIKNTDGSEVSKTALMNVGGGLFDKKVRSGDKATFNIQGFNSSNKGSNDLLVTWYQIDHTSGTPKMVKKEKNAFSYTTKATTEKDDGNQYYAKITMSYDGKEKTITTSKGLLTVLPSEDSNVVLTNSIQNVSGKDPEDTDTLVKNIINNDMISYDMLLNNNGQQDLHDTNLFLYLFTGTTIKSIKIDDTDIPKDRYSFEDTKNPLNDLLKLNVGDLSKGQKHHVVITTTTNDITEQRHFASRPYFIGTDSNDNHYQSIGERLELMYIINKITPHFNNISFDPIVNFQSTAIKYRTNPTNAPNDIVYIDDQRKKKHPLKIMLKQGSDLHNDQGTVLNAKLMLHKSASAPVSIVNKQKVSESILDEPLKSVAWNRNEGLLLHINGGYVPAGIYHTNLIWSIEDAP